MDKVISFTQKIKEELCSLEDLTLERVKPLLSAFIRVSGTLNFRNGVDLLVLKTENATVAKYIYSLIKHLYPECNASFSYRKSMKFYKSTEYLLNLDSGIDEIFKDLDIDFLEDKIPFELTNKDLKVKGYLAGLFLACGSCNSPVSSNYHLEYYVNEESFAKAILKLTQKCKEIELNFKLIQRRSNFIVYLKKSDLISSFLAYLEANNSCLEFENIRIDRDFSNVTNRLMNCDAYNYKKSITKSKEQIDEIKILDKNIGINNILNEKVKLLCSLRLKEPEASYQELADMMSKELEISVSKSNVNHLFIKIKEMASKYDKK